MARRKPRRISTGRLQLLRLFSTLLASALSNELTETSFLALSRLDCPCASSSEQASTTTSPTTIIRALIMGRIVGRRISGHLLETLWNASELAIASKPHFSYTAWNCILSHSRK